MSDIVERLLEPDRHDPKCPFKNHCYCDGAPHDTVSHPLAAEAAGTILALRKEVDGLTTYARDISKAITGLSAGAGSEWFKPVGDDHFVDPAFAAERLSTMLADGRDAKRQLIRERRAAHQGAGEP